MTVATPNITGILLAGGESRRMGRDKGMIRIGNRYMYQYPLRILELLCSEILISTCKSMTIEEPYEQVCDEIPGNGPAGGILTCLERSSNNLNIIVSYDMPLLNADLFRLLLQFAEGRAAAVPGKHRPYDAVLPAKPDGHPEPLCGIYMKSASGVFRTLTSQGVFAVHRILGQLHTVTVPVGPAMPFYHPGLFENVNSPGDLPDLFPDFPGDQ